MKPSRFRDLAIVCALLGLGLACVGIWAFRTTPVAAPDGPRSQGGTDAATLSVWTFSLWRPWSDAPAPVQAPPPPPSLKLFSVMQRQGRLVAAIDPGQGGSLAYAGEGEAVEGWTVRSISAQAVDLERNGEKLHLALPP